jgi:peptide/nickel transport system substrate-binding protein
MDISRIATVLGVASILFGAEPGFAQKSKDTLRTARVDQYSVLDRYIDSGNHTVFTTHALYDDLITYDFTTQKYLPLLAKSWKRVDPTTLEFELREDATWHDASKLTADDVVYTINWITDPKAKLRQARNWHWIKSVEKTGPHTVRIFEKAPSRFDLMVLALTTPIMPKDVHGPLENKADFSKKAIGTGPYKLAAFDPNSAILLEKNQKYVHGNSWRTAGKVGKIEIRLIGDYGTQTAEMLAGNLDMMGPVTLDVTEPFAGRSDYAVQAYSSFSYTYMMINVFGESGVPALKNPKVREAMMMAVNPDDIYAVIGGKAKVDWPEHMCWQTKIRQVGCEFTKKPPSYDPARAKKLLAEAGYPDGFKLDLVTIPGLFRDASVAVAGNLRAIGIQADVKALARPAYNAQIKESKFPVILRGWSGGVIPDVADTLNYFLTGEHEGYISTQSLREKVGVSNDEPNVKKFKDQARDILDEVTGDYRIRMLTPIPDIFVLSKDTVIERPAPVAASIVAWGLNWK